MCPICKSSFNEFGIFGKSQRKNARCYYCDSLERYRLLWKYLNVKTNLFSETNKSLLYFAPEKAFHEIFSNNKYIQYFPCDLLSERFNYNGKINIEKVDITKIPFNDNCFDVVICYSVLEHIVEIF
jgi:hypothetical protein